MRKRNEKGQFDYVTEDEFIQDVFSNVVLDDKTGCWIWQLGKLNKKDYGVVSRNRKQISVHVFMWEFYNGTVPEGKIVCHSCDNPPCCNPKHLFVGTYKDNTQDAVKKGRMNPGEKHHAAKLTNEDVKFIRSGVYQTKKLSEIFNMSKHHIRSVKNGRSWRHLNG